MPKSKTEEDDCGLRNTPKQKATTNLVITFIFISNLFNGVAKSFSATTIFSVLLSIRAFCIERMIETIFFLCVEFFRLWFSNRMSNDIKKWAKSTKNLKQKQRNAKYFFTLTLVNRAKFLKKHRNQKFIYIYK